MSNITRKQHIHTFFAGLVPSSSPSSTVAARFLAPRVRAAGGPAGEGATAEGGGTEASFFGVALAEAFLGAAFFLATYTGSAFECPKRQEQHFNEIGLGLFAKVMNVPNTKINISSTQR